MFGIKIDSKWLSVCVVVTSYIFMAAYAYTTISNYFVRNEWDGVIIGLGHSYTQRALIQTHLVCGLYSMLLYPCQTYLSQKIYLHITIGITICLAMILSAIAGLTYISMYGTIGGKVMSIFFGINGVIVFCLGLGILMINLKYRHTIGNFIKMKPTESPDDTSSSFSDTTTPTENSNLLLNTTNQMRVAGNNKFKKIHTMCIYLFGSAIYSSFFYRILYMYASLFGYTMPSDYNSSDYNSSDYNSSDYNSTQPQINQSALFNRPLDIFFQFAFFCIPLSIMIVYSQVKKSRMILKLILLGFNLVNILLLLISK